MKWVLSHSPIHKKLLYTNSIDYEKVYSPPPPFWISTVANAQLNVLGNLSGAFKSNTTSSSSSQDDALTSGISSLLGSLLGNSTLSSNDVQGTWRYKGVDCVFKTENVLMKAGGEAATAKVEAKINDALKKVGVTSEALAFTFNTDNTFTINVKGRNLKGTYTLDLESKKITISNLNGVGTITPQIVKNGTTMNLLYDADKLLKFLTTISAVSNNSTLKSLNTLLESYDGMLIGWELQK